MKTSLLAKLSLSRYLLSLLAITFCLPMNAETAMKLTGKQRSLILSPEMSQALKNQRPQFEMYRFEDFCELAREIDEPQPLVSTLFAVLGDYNGDKAADIIALGSVRGTKQTEAIAIISDGSTFKVIPTGLKIPYLDPTAKDQDGMCESGIATYLVHVPAKDLSFKKGETSSDAFGLETFGMQPGDVYFMRPGKGAKTLQLSPYKGE